MTSQQIITAISQSDHDPLLKAQCIALIRTHWRETRMVPLNTLLEYCAMCVGITVDEIKCPIKTSAMVRARQLYAHYGTRWYQLSEMGRMINRDHTTIIHNRDKALSLLESNDDIFLFDIANMERVMIGEQPIPGVPKTIVRHKVIVDNKTGKHYETVYEACMGIGLTYQDSIPNMNRKAKFTRFERKYLEVSK